MDMLEPVKFATPVAFKKRYGSYTSGEWLASVKGQYFDNVTHVTGRAF